jgi:hypothetical protein
MGVDRIGKARRRKIVDLAMDPTLSWRIEVPP